MKKFYVLFCVLMCVLSAGCKGGAEFPKADSRANARNVVMAVSMATKAAVGVCVDIMDQLDDDKAEEVGQACRNVLVPLINAIKRTAAAVDNWNDDSGALGKVACLAKLFAKSVEDFAALAQKYGAPIPSLIVDALPFVNTIAQFAPATCS